MELREKPGVLQRVAEASIRFRLVLLALMIPLWAVFAHSWTDFISCLLAGAEVNGLMIFSLMQGEVPLKSLLLGPMFAIILLFLVRGKFFGWRNGLLWLGGVVALMLLMFLLEGSEPILAFVVMAILVLAVTLLFFVKSLVAVTLLPLLLLAYGLSTWLLSLQVTPVGWQGIMALFLADSVAMLVGVGLDLRAGRQVTGAVSGSLHRHLPVILSSFVALAATDIFFVYLGVPVLGAQNLLLSLLVYFSYVVWMLAVFVPVISFCPLGRLRASKRTLKTSRS